MKQLLFLLLFPCLAMAQYPGNAGQKITLGEQTTADGLVYRGLASDTTRKPSVDTMAYILLDTNTNIIWQYKKAVNNAWTRVGGSISSGVTGVLPVANGGTNTSTAFTDGSVVFAGASGTYAQDNTNLFWDNASSRLGIGTNALLANRKLTISGTTTSIMRMEATSNNGEPSFELFGKNSSGATRSFVFKYDNSELFRLGITQNVPMRFETNDISRLYIKGTGEVGIGIDAPTEKLHVVGNARITGAYDVTTASAANVFVTTTGVLQRSTSSIKYKTDVEDYSKGLKEVMQLRPVTFKSINSNNDKTYAGFIAEELADLKLNELVENNDNDEPDAISYAYMVTLLTKAIQEQQEQISQLKKRLLILENK